MERRDRSGKLELRDTADGPVIFGYAAVFNADSEDMGFIEQIDPRAFDKTIREADVRGLFNHDPSRLLARSKNGTMRLFVDSTGLGYEMSVDPANPLVQDVLSNLRAGNLDGSSFSFRTIQDQWDWSATPPQRRLLEVALEDVGPVTFPAYQDATSAARSALQPIAKRMRRNVDELVKALQSGEIRSIMSKPESRDLSVVFGQEDGIQDLMSDCDAQLGMGAWTYDVALDLSRIIVCSYEDGCYYQAPITVDDQNEPTVAPREAWIQVDWAWTAATAERALRMLSEKRQGKVFSSANQDLLQTAYNSLRDLLDQAQLEEAGDNENIGESMDTADPEDDEAGEDKAGTRSFRNKLIARERELRVLQDA